MRSFFKQILKKRLKSPVYLVKTLFFVPRMMLDNLLAEHIPVDMGIDFGGPDAFVPQHGLDSTQVGSAFQEVGGERVAEGVGANGLFQADETCQLLYYMEHHDAGDVFSEPAYEHKVFVFGLYFCIAALYEIILQFVNGAGRDGHEALLASLAFHLDEAFVQIEVG